MKTLALRLKPLSGPCLAFQNELPRSDTVFGAIVWGMRDLGVDTNEFLSLYNSNSPPLVVSSVFPYIQEEDEKDKEVLTPILLLPRPMYVVPGGEDFKAREKYAEYKKRKKAEWLQPDGFNETIAKGALPQEKSKYHSLGKPTERPRVRIPRLGGETELFHQKLFAVPFAWLALRGDEEWLKKAKAALKLIGERGLGGGITYGTGAFEIEDMELPFQEVADGNAWVSLSLYYPKDEEWQAIRKSPLSAYKVEYRKGRVDASRVPGRTNIFKRPVLYMAEGSVLPWLENPAPGRNPEVTPCGENKPGFEVFAQGVAFAVRANKGGKSET